MSLSTEQRIGRLQRALELGGPTHTVSDVIQLLHEKRARLFENNDGLIIAEINKYPLLNAVNFWLMSGSLPDIVALEPEVCEWAREEEGASVATATGRFGWGRVGWPLGWRPWWPNFHKVLT